MTGHDGLDQEELTRERSIREILGILQKCLREAIENDPADRRMLDAAQLVEKLARDQDRAIAELEEETRL
jgi:hypothetical protein